MGVPTSFVVNRRNVLPRFEDVCRDECVSMNLANNDNDENTEYVFNESVVTNMKSMASIIMASTVFMLATLSPTPMPYFLETQPANAAVAAPTTATTAEKKAVKTGATVKKDDPKVKKV